MGQVVAESSQARLAFQPDSDTDCDTVAEGLPTMGWTADLAERELVAVASEVNEVARQLVAIDPSSWRSLAADRFRAELDALAPLLRRAATGVEEAAWAATDHARALREATVPVSAVTALGPGR